MSKKTMVLLVLCASLLALVGFIMSFGYYDKDTIVEDYMQTVNGSYWSKSLRVDKSIAKQAMEYNVIEEEAKIVEKNEVQTETTTSGWSGTYTGDYMTEDATALSLIEKVKLANVSDVRKAVAIRALANVGNPSMIYLFGGGHDVSYKSPTSTRLDCSSYCSWCYFNSGVDIGVKSTGEMINDCNETDLVQAHSRGIGSIGDIVVARSNGSGHAAIIVWYDDSGLWYAHEASSGKPPVLSKSVAEYKSHGGFKWVRHTLP